MKRFIFVLFGSDRYAHKVYRRLDVVMGRLDAIQSALDLAGSTAADEAVQVSAHLEALKAQIAELQASVDLLTAGAVTDEEIAALVAQAEALAATVEAIDTEGDVAPEPEPVPEPEPEPVPEEEPAPPEV